MTSAIEAPEEGLGVALGMNPLIAGRCGFGRRLVAPFDLQARRKETLYLVSRTEQANDRRVRAFRRWIRDAIGKVVTLPAG